MEKLIDKVIRSVMQFKESSIIPDFIVKLCSKAIPSNQWFSLVSPISNRPGPFLISLPLSQSGKDPTCK